MKLNEEVEGPMCLAIMKLVTTEGIKWDEEWRMAVLRCRVIHRKE